MLEFVRKFTSLYMFLPSGHTSDPIVPATTADTKKS
jgi:hypothetical protein